MSTNPTSPKIGDCRYDTINGCMRIYNGRTWITDATTFAPIIEEHTLIPTTAELEKHPTLEAAWNEYLVIRKLLGI